MFLFFCICVLKADKLEFEIYSFWAFFFVYNARCTFSLSPLCVKFLSLGAVWIILWDWQHISALQNLHRTRQGHSHSALRASAVPALLDWLEGISFSYCAQTSTSNSHSHLHSHSQSIMVKLHPKTHIQNSYTWLHDCVFRCGAYIYKHHRTPIDYNYCTGKKSVT